MRTSSHLKLAKGSSPAASAGVRWSVHGSIGIPRMLRGPSAAQGGGSRAPKPKVGESFNRAPISPGRVRLKRTLNRRVGQRVYFKWLIADVPPATVEDLGWQEGEELEGVPRQGGLYVRQAKQGVDSARRPRRGSR